MNLSRNGLIVLISVIFVAGAGTAYAGIVLPMITLAGDVTITGDTTLQGDLICTDCVDSADILDCEKEAALTRAVPTFVSSSECGSINVKTVESSDSALSTSIAIGQDDFPVMSYIVSTNDQLRFVHCTKQDCSTFDSRNIVESVIGFASTGTSIAVGTDGFPVISYWDGTFEDLMFVHCTSQDCLTFDTPLVLDSAGDVGKFLSMAIGTDSFPVISYFDEDTLALKFVHCKAVNCQSSPGVPLIDTPLELDSGGTIGTGTSVAIGIDTFPVISYNDESAVDLVLIHCKSINCQSSPGVPFIDTPVVLDTDGPFGFQTSITIGTDGFPVVAYPDGNLQFLKFVHCVSINCSTFDAPKILDGNCCVGGHSSVAIGVDGFPVIGYSDSSNQDLKFIHCTNEDCSAFDNPKILDSPGNFVLDTSTAIGADGFPVFGYSIQSSPRDAKIVHCADSRCLLD